MLATEAFQLILYFLAIVLLIALITFIVKLCITLNKVDSTLEDINKKSRKLDGLFNIVDKSADAINVISDTTVNFVTSAITGFINRRKKEEESEDIDYE